MFPSVKTVEWIPDAVGTLVPGRVRLLDQTRLPEEVRFLETADLEVVREAIQSLRVRGAPAIGVAAALGLAAAAQNEGASEPAVFVRRVSALAERLAEVRPTAVNLRWALDRLIHTLCIDTTVSVPTLKEQLVREALRIAEEDAAMCRAIGEHGLTLLHDGDTILTHCNAGALATAGIGTALAPVYLAQERGWTLRVFVDETRPLLQGARLTAWELLQAGIDVTLICDNTAAQVLREGRVQAVLVGADRIAANGDTANKIGTYGLAVLARTHGVPFYVLAPSSTLDLSAPDGTAIPIEHRGAREITEGFGKRTAPAGVKTYSPAFDVTPAHLITAIVTENGMAHPDYRLSLPERNPKRRRERPCR